MPATTFNISATSQDGTVYGTDVTWPPSAGGFAATYLIDSWQSYDGEIYTYEQGVMRWDTSSLPDDATIDSALLRVYVMDASADATREYVAAWYDHGGTIGTEDYDSTQPPNEDAHAGTALSSITNLQYKDFALSNLGNISKTGFTGLRTSITTDGLPPGLGVTARVLVADFDEAENAPQLVVTYTEGEPPPPPVTIPQVGVFDPHLNPQAWF